MCCEEKCCRIRKVTWIDKCSCSLIAFSTCSDEDTCTFIKFLQSKD